ncbi:MAG: hypothetical protein JSV99_11555 [Planctomycetota bacterium]|nr:MAG: hypothetical protein JSV99_11555 [Planctomycetota bacterium]
MNDKRARTHRAGTALLVVLIIVMAITILSLGFLSRSDVELACGENTILRTQMDYLAESGLEHARGLIVNPQDVSSEYWTGAEGLQLVPGSNDYYDVNVVKLGECNYQITCDAYRMKNGERIGSSRLTSELRLDPVIAFWAGGAWQSEVQTTVNGDVYCDGSLGGEGDINGDAFAKLGITALYIEGRKNENVTQSPVAWAGLDINDFSSTYYYGLTSHSVQDISSGVYSNCTFGSALSEPPEVFYCAGDIELAGGVTINGMLVVGQNMIVSDANSSSANVITAGKNFPALLVSGDAIMRTAGTLQVNGLAQIGNRINVDDAAENVDIDIVGGLYIANGEIDGVNGSSLSNSINITAAPAIASIEIWPTPGNPVRWTPCGGAFFRSIERN